MLAAIGLGVSLIGSYLSYKGQKEAANAQNEYTDLQRYAARKSAEIQKEQLSTKQFEESKQYSQYKLEQEKSNLREMARLENALAQSSISGKSVDRLYTEFKNTEEYKRDISEFNRFLQTKSYLDEYTLIDVNKQNRLAGLTDVKGPDTTSSVISAIGSGLTTYNSLGGFK